MEGLRVSTVIFVLLPSFAFALQFYLHEGETRCFSDSVAPNTKVLGEYTVAAGQGRMPVDIFVRDIANNNRTLFSRTDINHGKFAFITPFEKHEAKIHTSELHRKEHSGHEQEYMRDHDHFRHVPEHDHVHDHEHEHEPWDHHPQDDHVQHRRTRGILSIDSDTYSQDHSHDHYDPAHHDTHGAGDEHLHDHLGNPAQYPRHDYTTRGEHHYDPRDPIHHDGDHLPHVEHDKSHDDQLDKLDHMDAHDGRHDDMKGEWDMEHYDGLDDEELEKEWLEQERQRELEKANVAHPVSDDGDELFATRTFEICVSSTSTSTMLKRRVRLVLRHGKSAHDYTRLAKTEHMSSLEITLKVVSDELKELHSELDHARQMEDVLRLVNEATNRRVATYSTISLLTMVAVATAQALYTKKFFKHKKVL